MYQSVVAWSLGCAVVLEGCERFGEERIDSSCWVLRGGLLCLWLCCCLCCCGLCGFGWRGERVRQLSLCWRGHDVEMLFQSVVCSESAINVQIRRICPLLRFHIRAPCRPGSEVDVLLLSQLWLVAQCQLVRVNVFRNVSTNCDSYFVPQKNDANASKLQKNNLG